MLKKFENKYFNDFFSSDNLIHYLSLFFLFIFIWLTLLGLFTSPYTKVPGPLFNLMILFVFSYLCGQLVSLVKLPPLLGMLAFGFLMKNLFDIEVVPKWSLVLRRTAIAVNLLRAGLELDPKKIVNLSAVCIRLSTIPCLTETITFAISAYLIIDYPLEWCFLIGFILAAVSPAVVVVGVLSLKGRGYGLDKGIPTLLMAASSIDDVLAISGAMICLRLIFHTESEIALIIIKAPLEALIGISYGILFGLILWSTPLSDNSLKSQKQRVLLLFFSGVSVKFIANKSKLDIVGPLASIIISFTASLEWRKKDLNKTMQTHMRTLWIIFEPLLFGLIGADVNIKQLMSGDIGLALICLLMALLVRCLTVLAVVYGADLNLRERVFIALAWIPKATVQATLGQMAMDFVRNQTDKSQLKLAEFALSVAFLSILITAPIGSLAIALSGPKLLRKTKPETYDSILSYTENEND